MFSDESTFQTLRTTSRCVRRPKHSDRNNPCYTIKTVKHPDSVTVWGAFSGSGGRNGLHFLPKNSKMNSKRYLNVLEEDLIPSMETHECDHFLQDSAPCHKGTVVTQLLKQQNFDLIEWPGNSPDLNPIEHCWSIMKEKMKNKNTSSITLLTQEIKNMWNTYITPSYCKILSKSMPGRLKKVIARKGQMTKY